MRFQPVKCNMMQLTKKHNKIQALYTLEGIVLENVESIKYLGVTIKNLLFFTSRLSGKNILLFLFRNVSSNNTSQTPAASPNNLPTSSDSCEPPAKKKCTSGLLCILGHCLSALLRYNVETNIKPSIIMTKDYAQCQNPYSIIFHLLPIKSFYSMNRAMDMANISFC